MTQPVATTIFQNIDEVTRNISNGITWITSVFVVNTTTADAYLQLFDLAAANVTLGTTVPILVIPVPGNADANAPTGFESAYFGPQGWYIANRLSVAATTLPTGSSGVADGVHVQVFIQ